MHRGRNELERFFSSQKEFQRERKKEKFDEFHEQREREKQGYQTRQLKTLVKKRTEQKQLQESLDESIQLSNSIIHNDLEEKRQYLAENGSTRFNLDDTTSTIVPIPEEFINRVKTAKR